MVFGHKNIVENLSLHENGWKRFGNVYRKIDWYYSYLLCSKYNFIPSVSLSDYETLGKPVINYFHKLHSHGVYTIWIVLN